MATALKKIANAILGDNSISENDKETSIELLSFLSEEAMKPKSYRKKNVIGDVIDKLNNLSSLTINLKKIWDYCYPMIIKFFQ